MLSTWYSLWKNVSRRLAADKLLHNKVFDIAKNPKFNGYQRGLASIDYKCFDEKTSDANKGTGTNSQVAAENKKLAEKLQKPIIRKLEKRIVNLSFIDNIWVVDPADM